VRSREELTVPQFRRSGAAKPGWKSREAARRIEILYPNKKKLGLSGQKFRSAIIYKEDSSEAARHMQKPRSEMLRTYRNLDQKSEAVHRHNLDKKQDVERNINQKQETYRNIKQVTLHRIVVKAGHI
jgi:hypothetical protein